MDVDTAEGPRVMTDPLVRVATIALTVAFVMATIYALGLGLWWLTVVVVGG